MELQAWLEQKGIKSKPVGNNLQMHCPLCDDSRQRLGININSNHSNFGFWSCLNGGCGAKGRSLSSFQKRISKHFGESREKIDLTASSNGEEFDLDINQKLAIKFYKNAFKNKKRNARKYLKEQRGFKKTTIEHFMLGSKRIKGHEFVSIPFWENGELVNLKYRAVIMVS